MYDEYGNPKSGGSGCFLFVLAAALVVVFVAIAWPSIAVWWTDYMAYADSGRSETVQRVEGYVSEDTARGMLQDAYEHDEAMTDRVVTVAVSGDISQTLIAGFGQCWPVLFLVGILGGFALLVMRAGGKRDS